MDMRLICGHAIAFCNFTTRQNPDGRLKREVDYSESSVSNSDYNAVHAEVHAFTV